MKYGIRECLFWKVFEGGFKRELKNTLHISSGNQIMKKAHGKYKEMLSSAQDPHNRFTMNIIFASVIGAVYLSLDKKPPLEQMITFVHEAVMNNKIFLKFIVSEKNYTLKGQKILAENAKKSENDNNPYSWQFTYEAGKTPLEYTVFFKT